MAADDISDLVAKLDREELQQARQLSAEEKIFAGPRLFETACWITLAGIRHQFPGASEETCLDILRQRIEFQKKLEETQCMTISMAQAHSGNKTGSRP
jgi:hypothetical protein